MYIPAAQLDDGVEVDFVWGGCGAESEPRKKRGWPRWGLVSTTRYNTEGRHTLAYNLPKRLPIIGIFCDGFTIIPTVSRPVIDRECEVVCCDRTPYSWPE